jgi:DNA-binding transcriptional MerR regulator
VGAIRLLPGGGWERVVPIDVPGQGRSWLNPKDAEAINAITGGALCSISAGFACPNKGEKIADNVAAAADTIQYAFLIKSLLKAGISLAAIAMVIKKDPEDVAKLAANVVKDFKNLECKECAEALLKEFNKAGINGTIRELTSNGAPMVRAGQNTGEAISFSGRHFGVQVGERIYDLYHPGGIPINHWKNAYESIKGVELLPLVPQ